MGVSKGGTAPFGRGLGNPQKNTHWAGGWDENPEASFLKVLEAAGMDDSEESPPRNLG